MYGQKNEEFLADFTSNVKIGLRGAEKLLQTFFVDKSEDPTKITFFGIVFFAIACQSFFEFEISVKISPSKMGPNCESKKSMHPNT